MKSILKICSIIFFSLTCFSSCKNDDSSVNPIFLGKYHGSVNYSAYGETKSNFNGFVDVKKNGIGYQFTFSDDIPTITELVIHESNNTLTIVDSNSSNNITVTSNKIIISYSKNGATWTANCSR